MKPPTIHDCTTGPDGHVSGWGEKLRRNLAQAKDGDVMIVRRGGVERAREIAEQYDVRVVIEADGQE